MNMNTLLRNTTLGFSRRRRIEDYAYEILDQNSDRNNGEDDKAFRVRRASSKRKKDQPYLVNSVSYRRERAKKRQIFLKSYQLSSIGNSESHPVKSKTTSKIFKKVFLKVKSAVITMVANARFDSLRSCAVSGPQAICGASPGSVIQPVNRRVYGS